MFGKKKSFLTPKKRGIPQSVVKDFKRLYREFHYGKGDIDRVSFSVQHAPYGSTYDTTIPFLVIRVNYNDGEMRDVHRQITHIARVGTSEYARPRARKFVENWFVDYDPVLFRLISDSNETIFSLNVGYQNAEKLLDAARDTVFNGSHRVVVFKRGL